MRQSARLSEARRRRRARSPLDEEMVASAPDVDVVALDCVRSEGLREKLTSRKCQVRYSACAAFAGMTSDEISPARSAFRPVRSKRDWRMARADGCCRGTQGGPARRRK